MKDNKLIAEFMSGEHPLAEVTHEAHHNYDTSWDWLMPVLIKIERIIVGEVTWISTYCDIEREYKRAVEWIKKYNDNPKHMTLQ